ncbi:DNA primase [Streptobacillus moniliformis]|uniref:DNA primase n=1 Tax=Streptobacillus moniliformis TaxID=34105 RepID=UPI0007E422A7|nr:DNA primase [Streptobacillus moniliformis]
MYKLSEDEEKIINNIDIVDLIGQYVDLNKAGVSYKGYSPFKSENTPSFSVHPVKKIFKDFSSGKGGNVISFYSYIKNISYYEALHELSKKYGINIKKSNSKYLIKDNIGHKILKDAMEFFRLNFEKSSEAKEYLINRGFNLNDLKRYDIGYATNDWNLLYNHLKEKYDVEELIKLGLVTVSSIDTNNIYDTFRERIIFPIFNIHQQVVGFGGRYIGENVNAPKYLNSTESYVFDKSSELYGLFNKGIEIKEKKYAILMEGFLDVLSSHINTFDNAVASLGTAFTEKQAKLLKKYTDNIIIMYDKDEAGQKATKSVINILNKLEFNIKCSSLPDGVKDPDEYFKKYSKDDFFEILGKSVGALDYIFEMDLKDFDFTQTTSKREAIELMKSYFENVTNDIVYSDEIEKFSRLIDVETKYILSKYIRNKNKNFKDLDTIKEVSQDRVNEKINKQEELEKLSIVFLLLGKEVDQILYNILKSFEFQSEKYVELHKKLLSIDYKIDEVSYLVLTKDEEEFMIETTCEFKNNYTDEDYIRIIKTWLELLIKKYEASIDILPINEKIDKKIHIGKLLNKLRNVVNINNLEKCYKEIIVLKGD